MSTVQLFTQVSKYDISQYSLRGLMSSFQSCGEAPDSAYLTCMHSKLSLLQHQVAQTILNIINSPNPELRNPVGKDAESIFKARTQLSDKELEQWAREVYMDKKGFIR